MMKRLLKACWRLTLPVRRPLSAKAEAFVAACVTRALANHNPTAVLAQDVSLTLDALIAEQERLRRQVEALRQRMVR